MNRLPVICIAVVAFSLGLHWGGENLSVVRFMDTILQINGYQMALFFLVSGASIVITSRVSGHIVRNQHSLLNIIIPGMILSGLFQSLVYWSQTFPQYLILRIIHTIGDGVIGFCIPMWLSLVFMKSRMGGNYGFNRTMISLGTVVGSIFSGYLIAQYSLGAPFFVTGILQLVFAVLILALKGRLDQSIFHHSPVLASPASSVE